MSGVDGTSRFSRVKFPCMLGVFDRAEPDQCSRFRIHRCCLPHDGTASALWFPTPFTAQWPCLHVPCQRFTCSLATARAWLGARLARYALPVRLFHSRLHAGLSRRSPTASKTRVFI